MRRFALFVAICILLAAGLAAANLRRDPSAVRVDWRIARPEPREVLVEAPALGPIVETIAAPGTVEAVDEAEIASQVVGRVVEVAVRDGDTVKRDAVLIRLDETQARAQLDSAIARIDRLNAAIAQAQFDLEKADRDEGQSSRLAGKGFSTPTELADARTGRSKARAALAMSRKELIEGESMRKLYAQDLDRTVIRSPIDGIVSGLEVDVGEVVIAGTTNLPGSLLMTISDPAKVRVRADVDETDVPSVRPGQPARIYLQADPTRPVPGKVDRVSAKGKVKGEVTSFETLIDVDPVSADGRAAPTPRPGMTTTVEVEVRRSERATGVPVHAVVHRRRKDLPDSAALRAYAERDPRSPGEKAAEAGARYVKVVFVVDADGLARARPVETGISDERRVEVLGGLQPGEKVVVGPFRALDELKDGQPARPVAALTDEVGGS